ncbi:MAG TPA: ATP-binding cassette domain-containing protein [Armatimonadota bacterium]|nr:ATP-binding cassette domain-containing protein [Armatimonadota bacterium]
MGHIIAVENLTKSFPNGVVAVTGVSFSVKEGEIFGFLGPNGAGKSTTISILTTLIPPTSGTVVVAGYDVKKHPTRVRFSIGYVSQDLAVDDDLTGYDNLRMQAGLYHIPRKEVEQRIDDVLKMVDLTERAGDLVETYSGGMRKRLDIACGLIHRPRLLFLDEPTLGLDIQTRHLIWQYVNQLRSQIRMTIFLTTHYMDEADALCDRIAIIDYGKIKALDSPGVLKSALGGDMVDFQFQQGTPEEIAHAVQTVDSLPNVREICPLEDHRYRAIVSHGESVVPEIFEALAEQPARIGTITMKRPSLDDVFLHYTGRELRETGGNAAEAFRTRMTMRRTRG